MWVAMETRTRPELEEPLLGCYDDISLHPLLLSSIRTVARGITKQNISDSGVLFYTTPDPGLFVRPEKAE